MTNLSHKKCRTYYVLYFHKPRRLLFLPKKEPGIYPAQAIEKVRHLAVFCFLLFGFYAGVFGALPPFPTSFLVPKKEVKKASAASPLTIVLLKAVVFRQSAAASPLFKFSF